MIDPMLQADALEHGQSPVVGFALAHALKAQRQRDIFKRGKSEQKIEGLENHADFFATQARARVVAE